MSPREPSVSRSAVSLKASWEYVKKSYLHRKNYVQGYEELFSRYGDIAADRFFFRRWVFFHPDHVQHIFKDNGANYRKGSDFDELKVLFGEGLFTSGGKQWARDRRIIGPEFHTQAVQGFSRVIVDAASELIRSWRAEPDQSVREISSEMSALTFKIIGRALFDKGLDDTALQVAESLRITQDTILRRIMSLVKLPYSVPTARNRSHARALRTLDRIVFGIIDGDAAAPGERDAPATNLLAKMRQARDSESGERLSREEIRDQVMTLMIAGHETTGNALSWTLYLLSRHPEIQGGLREELQEVLRGAPPSYEDMKALQYTRRVIDESMRLYPPVPVLSREAIEDDTISGFRIRKGSTVEVSQWVTHRHPAFWADPLKFDPERFQPSAIKAMHPFAYFPFGAGQRICIGRQFALTEAVLILAILVQNFEISKVSDEEVGTEPLLTLRPKGGMRVRLRRI